MNRQVGPSIVCSVLIVCFFAVVFFPHRAARPSLPQPAAQPSGNAVTAAAAADSDRSQVKRPPPASRPTRFAVTVVEADETMADVAVRVYGTSDHALTLWRANRDALPRMDTPLSAGMLLRTPPVPVIARSGSR
jgi:hypothetical protein